MKFSCVILNGGNSRRLGVENKGLLKIKEKTLIEIVYEVVKPLFEEVLIITNSPGGIKSLGLKAKIFQDEITGFGPLGGIYTGLKKISTEKAFFVACDMPLIDERLIRNMSREALYHDAVCPAYEEFIEPLHAFYGIRCIEAIESILAMKKSMKVREIYNYVNTLFYKVSEKDFKTFFNINSWEDFKKAESMMV
ncbi:molybdenum cofactor guanylyltransferase [Thermovenabulum sp.]|uniref:molybdenum cofactor guanylyltransferase n=1 Tax=Thermovenabulum sp. TaxID=3100335 RepID=UPI003C7CD9D7